MGRKSGHFGPKRKEAFLVQLVRLGSIAAASRASGCSAVTVHNHMNKDPEFKAAVDVARIGPLPELIATARMMAIEGVPELVFDKNGKQLRDDDGEPVIKLRYNAPVLLRWLARLDPDNWSDTVKVDQTVRGKVEHVPGSFHPKDLSPRRRAAMREMLRRDDDDPSRN